tara:strand:- start:132 stop:578 length:447 start_codon:yes stop_codon:yes gene_type:complete
MAIINNKIKPLKNDRDEKIFIGIDLPFRKSDGNEGWFASTKTTFDAVRNNVKSLLLTERGERIMQPSLGLNLKKYLFEPLDEDLRLKIESEILQTFDFWLPFVNVIDLQVTFNGDVSDIGRNKIDISLSFNIKQNQDYFDTVSVTIGE